MSIKQHLYPVLSGALKPVPYNWVIKPIDQTYFLPFYHVIADQPPAHVKHLYPVINFKTFQKQLERLLAIYHPVSLSTFHHMVQAGESTSKPVMHLSFDDGLKECIDVSEWLKSKGIPATFFLNSAFIGGADAMYRYKVSLIIDKLEKELKSNRANKINLPIFEGVGKDTLLQMNYSDSERLDEMVNALGISTDYSNIYLNEQDIQQLIKQGFEIGGHSHDHPNFGDISFEEQKKQIKENVEMLAKTFGKPIKSFAFPFTDHGVSHALIEWMQNELRLDMVFGTAGLKTNNDKFLFQRFPMEEFGIQHLKAEYVYFYLKKMIGKNHHQLSSRP